MQYWCKYKSSDIFSALLSFLFVFLSVNPVTMWDSDANYSSTSKSSLLKWWHLGMFQQKLILLLVLFPYLFHVKSVYLVCPTHQNKHSLMSLESGLSLVTVPRSNSKLLMTLSSVLAATPYCPQHWAFIANTQWPYKSAPILR